MQERGTFSTHTTEETGKIFSFHSVSAKKPRELKFIGKVV